VADTDVAITNTFYLHDLTAGAQLDFNQLLVYVDGLLMTVSTDPANGDGQDVYPGSDGSNIRFNFDLSSLMTVQVIRNV
jgi:archaellum component FlaG (FlaF/FlaG flagellin family)